MTYRGNDRLTRDERTMESKAATPVRKELPSQLIEVFSEGTRSPYDPQESRKRAGIQIVSERWYPPNSDRRDDETQRRAWEKRL